MIQDLQFHIFCSDPQLYERLRPHWRTDGAAILKGVPVYLKDRVQATLRSVRPPSKPAHIKDISVQQAWNTVFRGPRRHRNTACTLLRDAHSFDIYLRGVRRLR